MPFEEVKDGAIKIKVWHAVVIITLNILAGYGLITIIRQLMEHLILGWK